MKLFEWKWWHNVAKNHIIYNLSERPKRIVDLKPSAVAEPVATNSQTTSFLHYPESNFNISGREENKDGDEKGV